MVSVLDSPSTAVFHVERHGGVLVITPTADFRCSPDAEFTAQVMELVASVEPDTTILIDFCQVSSFSSDRLLGPMTVLWKRICKQKGKLRICNICAGGREVLRRMKLDSLWLIFATRHEALQGLRT